MKYEKFLPIGSVVMLKGGEKRVMVIGYLPMPDDDDLDKIYDYVGCIYPEGLISTDEILVFNHDQVDKVYSIGYKDEEEEKFQESIKEVEKEINEKGVEAFKKDALAESEGNSEEVFEEKSNNPEENLNIEEVN